MRSAASPHAGPQEAAAAAVLEGPVFVVSAPRAGGTLLRDLLAASRQLVTVGDGETGRAIAAIPALHPANRGWASQRLTDLDSDPDFAHAVRTSLAAAVRLGLERPAEGRRPHLRLLDRDDAHTLRVPWLAATFPDALFVYVHRDARQNVSSLIDAWRDRRNVSIPALPGWARGRWYGPLPDGWRDYGDASRLELASFQWAAANECALDDLELLSHDRWIDVAYAELVADPHAVAARVFELVGLEFDEALRETLERPWPLGDRAPPSPIKWRADPEFHESALARYNVLRGRLRELGGTPAPPPPRRPTVRAIHFACLLDRIVRESMLPLDDRQWLVNPTFQLQVGSTIPLSLVRRTRFRERFLPDLPLAWVENGLSGVLQPFWLPVAHLQPLRHLRAGQPPPALSDELAAQLAAAEILVAKEGYERRRRDGDALVEAARPAFAERRYCTLPSVIHAAHIGALGDYYDALIARGNWSLGDAQVAQRYGWHNEPVARYFHHQLAGLVARVAGEPVRPSYCYVSAYRGGNVSLRPHVDRKQCVFTLSLWIGEQDTGDSAWPFWLHSPAGIVSVTQSAGDAVLFRGCELPHWRDRPPPGGASTALIFHYVPQDFVGVLD